jgi:DNA mismatch repair ATPase MutL
MMKSIFVFLIGAALGAGGFYYGLHAGPAQVEAEKSAPPEMVTEDEPAPEKSLETSVVADRSGEVQRLKQELAERDRELAAYRVASQSSAVLPEMVRQAGGEDRQSWLENLRTTDPENYQQLMERREAARQAARYEIAKRAAHFIHRDEELLTGEEVEQRQKMLALLQQSLELTEQWRVDMTEDERREISRTIRRNMRELSPLLETERDREFFRIGKDIGYTDDDAAAFALYMRDVVDMTSVRSIFRNSMREMGGWGGWGGWGDRDGGEERPR